MATKAKADEVEAFVLRDCGFGMAGEVVTLPTADAETGAAHGMLDLHPDAIKATDIRQAIKATDRYANSEINNGT